ncbi:MAG: hypothetical protein ABL936_10310, partial [Aestuariivirga sp.]
AHDVELGHVHLIVAVTGKIDAAGKHPGGGIEVERGIVAGPGDGGKAVDRGVKSPNKNYRFVFATI